MATIVFVHGTGVRKLSYDSTLAVIRNRIEFSLPSYQLKGCDWGDWEGCKLLADGASIPDYDTARAIADPSRGTVEPDAADLELSLWRMLYDDPDSELRSLEPGATGGFVAGAESAFEGVIELLGQEDEAVRQARNNSGIADDAWRQAKSGLTGSPALRRAMMWQSVLDADLRSVIARALVARAIAIKFRVPEPPDDWPSGQQREALVNSLCNQWGGSDRGPKSWVRDQLKWVAFKVITDKTARKRGVISDAAYPVVGDILLYQTRSEGIREFIKRNVEKQAEPVILLAHSLGGIACFEMLATGQLQDVRMLITVGSQAPLFYELDVLPNFRYGTKLPDPFPEWVNIFDRRDFLSYVGKGIFGKRVVDIPVDNGQPFPESHSAYWRNPTVWDAIIPRLKGLK
jgi:hypothetical protein